MMYILIGFLAGIISGMGIGGGTILIPALVIFAGVSQQSAQIINLLYFVPTALIALSVHIKCKTIEKDGLLKLILFGVGFAALGSFVAVNIDESALKRIFGVFLLVMGILEFFRKEEC